MITRQIQVLLVEDNKVEAELVREIMAGQNVEFVTVRSLKEAEEQLALEQPDAILLDITLPDSDGLETVEKMLDLSPSPVIILTGHDDIDVALQSVNIGATDHITKGSFNSDSLMRTILYAIERRNVLKRINVQSRSSEALMTCASVADALQLIIKNVCKELGWDFGCFWCFDKSADAFVTTRWPNTVAQTFIDSGEFKVHDYQDRNNATEVFSTRETEFIKPEDAAKQTVSTKSANTAAPRTGKPGKIESAQWYPQPAVDRRGAEIISDLTRLCAQDSQTDGKRSTSHCRAAVKAGMRSGMFIPIITYDTLFGVMEFFSARVHESDDHLIRHLNVLGSQIAHAIMRERAELALLTSEKRERTIANHVIQHAPAGIARLDADLMIVDTNNAFRRVIKVDTEPHGSSILTILPFLNHDEIKSCMKTKQPYNLHRWQMHGDNSSEDLYLSISVWPITGDEDEIIGAVAMVVDDTKQVSLEHQREDLVAAVAHDIKNPLIGAERVLIGLCEESEPINEEAKRSLLSLLSSTRNLVHLVQNLVDMYRYESVAQFIQPQQANSELLLRKCIEQLRPLAASNEIILSDEISSSTPDLYIDEMALSRVVLNLLYNAVKFTTAGGNVTLKSHSQGDYVFFTVKDTGIGMHQSEQETLFLPYSQGQSGKRLQSGTGLGLYISKLIIDAHNGEIDFRSDLGLGTTVTVKLPAYQACTAKKAVTTKKHSREK